MSVVPEATSKLPVPVIALAYVSEVLSNLIRPLLTMLDEVSILPEPERRSVADELIVVEPE